jgi:diguanylate cyclase (GGDEF)-like protein
VDSAAEKQEQLINAKVFENLGTINSIGQLIATSDDLNGTLESIYEQVRSVFPSHEFGIALYDVPSNMLDYCYFYNADGPVKRFKVNCETGGNMGAFVVNNLQTIHINSVTRDTLSPFLKQDLIDVSAVSTQQGEINHSILMTPILLKNELLGVLSLRAREMNQYHSYHRRLFEQLANFIGISLNNLQQKASLLIANQQLEKLSRTDPLTGLRNRHQLSEMFHQSIESAVINDATYTLALVDIDDYKQFNDTYGHQVGDEALKVVANLLSERFSDSNAHLFRYGGDEFLLLATGVSPSDLENRLTQLLEECQQLKIDGVSTPITLSVGAAMAVCPARATQFNLLFDLADEALYRVKHRGRNGFVVQTCQNEQLLPE